MQEKSFGPVVTAGILIGIGLGSLIEAVLFRMIIQSHFMLSAKTPVRSLAALKTNLLWDGMLQIVMLAILASGIIFLFQAARKKENAWSGQLLFGAWFLGWGIYNLIEGIAVHLLLKAHHLLEFSNPATQETGDYAFMGSGLLIGILGYWAIHSTAAEFEEKDRQAARSTRAVQEVKGDRKVYLD